MTKAERYMQMWQDDWNCFVRDVLKARLDREQQAIISSVQHNPRTAVASGTARGKDYVAACASLCFLFLTPRWKGEIMVSNTKVVMTAPTSRQVFNIMMPEISRLFRASKVLPGYLMSGGIKTDNPEWFLTGFKADDDNTEAWSGFHAANTMFVVTEASGIGEKIYNAIEGNLQGNSRLLIVFNPNSNVGYAANAMKSERWSKFRLNSLNAENVIVKKTIYQGQVDYEWVKDKVDSWCEKINEKDFNEGEGDFRWEGGIYRPNDLFRVKVLGMFPKESADTLIPYEWVVLANKRWKENYESYCKGNRLDIGVDVAGMGRDSSVWCVRDGNRVTSIEELRSKGNAEHMQVAGKTAQMLANDGNAYAYIDTIGEGAGVYSRLKELGYRNAISCKYSEGAKGLNDVTGVYEFDNMKSYLYWCVRDWLNPKNNLLLELPESDKLMEELTSIKWKFSSSGKIVIESKDETKKRIKRSPDYLDALANSFYPKINGIISEDMLQDFL